MVITLFEAQTKIIKVIKKDVKIKSIIISKSISTSSSIGQNRKSHINMGKMGGGWKEAKASLGLLTANFNEIEF